MVDVDIITFSGDFIVREESGSLLKARWEWTPTQPTRRSNGIHAWATINGVPGLRLHMCAKCPCEAKFPPAYYAKSTQPVPVHAQLVSVVTDAGNGKPSAIPSVVMEAAAASEVLPPPETNAPLPVTKVIT